MSAAIITTATIGSIAEKVEGHFQAAVKCLLNTIKNTLASIHNFQKEKLATENSLNCVDSRQRKNSK